jgi:hypothetical protein
MRNAVDYAGTPAQIPLSAIILGIVRTDAFQMDMVPADKSRPVDQKVADVR